MAEEQGPLAGLRVIEAASVVAGPTVGAILGDYGAEVIKVELPGSGDSYRGNGPKKDGVPLTWQWIGRNKRSITLDLRVPAGQGLFRKVAATADVVVEGFRPGTFEGWGIAYGDLARVNPRLVMARITGFGQTGPYRDRPGFGTLAEAFSGFSAITGLADGPPTLPPLGLADSVAALFTVAGILTALWDRDRNGSGAGQYVDVSLYEPLFSILGAQSIHYDQLGLVQKRIGNRSPGTAPRGAYQTYDGHWVALSGASPNTARRILRLVGGDELVADERFATNELRAENAEALDEHVGAWIAARPLATVLGEFEAVGAPIAPIYDIAQIMADPQYGARASMATVEHPKLGPLKLPNVVARLSRTPGRIRSLGPELGADNDLVYRAYLGLGDAELMELKSSGVI
jgi:crotonobetainyl-CoA:carnitine CoA-transferase CaiB-like acyl-CoA transferase